MQTLTKRHGAGFTLVELLVVIAVIGLLLAMLLPAVQAARESARATDCQNRLRQVGLATLMFHDANEAFPPARLWGTESEPFLVGYPSWLARILPYLEESAAGARWDFSETYQDADLDLRGQAITQYLCPSRRSVAEAVLPPIEAFVPVVYPCGCTGGYRITQQSGAAADYGGNHGDLSPDYYGDDSWFAGGGGTGIIIASRPNLTDGVPTGWRDRVTLAHVTDGTSKTTLAGEMFIPPQEMLRGPFDGPMYNGEDLSAFARYGGAGGAALARSPADPTLYDARTGDGWAISFGSWHPGYCPFVWADGSVRRVDVDIDLELYAQTMNRHDGGDTEGPGLGAPF